MLATGRTVLHWSWKPGSQSCSCMCAEGIHVLDLPAASTLQISRKPEQIRSGIICPVQHQAPSPFHTFWIVVSFKETEPVAGTPPPKPHLSAPSHCKVTFQHMNVGKAVRTLATCSICSPFGPHAFVPPVHVTITYAYLLVFSVTHSCQKSPGDTR